MEAVILDACVLINLLAARSILSPIQPRSGAALHVVEQVSREAIYLLAPDPDDPQRLTRQAVELGPFLEQGALTPCAVETPEEIEWFVRLAARLDDGEAASLALARLRGWTLATDDRLAARLARELNVAVVTTPELVWQWAQRAIVSRESAVQAVRDIQRYARFRPRSGSPRADWWTELLADVPAKGARPAD